MLVKQIDKKELDHGELREALPTAIFSMSAGKENPLAYYLATKDIAFHDVGVKFGTAPDWGINGKASIHALKMEYLATGHDLLYCQAGHDSHEFARRGHQRPQESADRF